MINKTHARVTNITAAQYQTIADQANMAQELILDERWLWFRDYFSATLDYAKKTIWEDTITDVEESHSITDKIVRTFKRDKKSQVQELIGQYKLVTKFFEDMNYYMKLKDDLDKQIEAGSIKIEGQSGGKDVSGPKTSE